jgi:hypothetical protein
MRTKSPSNSINPMSGQPSFGSEAVRRAAVQAGELRAGLRQARRLVIGNAVAGVVADGKGEAAHQLDAELLALRQRGGPAAGRAHGRERDAEWNRLVSLAVRAERGG